MKIAKYRGRFAPSPTGPLHAGSLATALASWLDAKSSMGVWLIRIEDVDPTRSDAIHSAQILQQLTLFGLQSDEKIIYQSERYAVYEPYLAQLLEQNVIYPCVCSRKKIQAFYENQGILLGPHLELVYPGFCRPKTSLISNTDSALEVSSRLTSAASTFRVKIPPNTLIQGQLLNEEVGDFVIQRADGIFSYQLAVVVDDTLQGITHVVRGADLRSNTPRQIWLQERLGLITPQYRHIDLILDANGNKLSKQTQAQALRPKSTAQVIALLNDAAAHLHLDLGFGLPPFGQTTSTDPLTSSITVSEWLNRAVNAWRIQYT